MFINSLWFSNISSSIGSLFSMEPDTAIKFLMSFFIIFIFLMVLSILSLFLKKETKILNTKIFCTIRVSMFANLYSLYNPGICLLQSFASQLLLLFEKIFMIKQRLLTFHFQIQLHSNCFLNGLLNGHNTVVESEQFIHVGIELPRNKQS